MIFPSGGSVPEARILEQQRLKAELLLQKPVLTPEELGQADATLLGGAGASLEFWRSWGAMPLQQKGQILKVAIPCNWGPEQRQQLLHQLGRPAEETQFQLALAADINRALEQQVTPAPMVRTRSLTEGLTLPATDRALQEGGDPEDLETSAANHGSPVVSLVDRILIEALESGASDIHVEPQEAGLAIRFRLDGVLQKQLDDLPKHLVPAITSRLKIMADLDISERRLPQDGRIRRNYRGRTMDFRVSTLPSRHGEKVCLRLLDSGATQLGLDSLITDPDARLALRALGSKPFGMILVTGPTGSGKSTTLYALLSERNGPGINISTVEDPIEYCLQGITQTQVNREKGFDFSTALRAFMRQDPDVLLVGETRDTETAKTALEAALTGHLVLTTLHCNDAASAIARLDEMGVEPFMVSASLLGIVSQRLLRRVCRHCRIPYQPSSEELGRFGLLASHETAVSFYRAQTSARAQHSARAQQGNPTADSCPHCLGNGYRGRIGVYEILRMNETIAAAVAKRSSTDALRRLALESGMKTLLGYGLDLVRQGHTTLEEVERMLLTDAGLESELRARSLAALSCGSCGAGLRDEWLECPYCLTARN
ncbi:type II/IV secretion system protein [Cyanobium sp. HWJ4-Hawea]|uniref:GspE/PulE family protein n=1 Tax=Cyanobium sp. HWJ4-Hawea TaxID=2823713 RepID=UPI0020CD0ED7|nr:GspE/PulE family protein [Cyanobium sp. HWJ4-Hawea]MCP9808103.1 type II/IV secretion system protein [Cyanobium sp. HWJ4-Hawea]